LRKPIRLDYRRGVRVADLDRGSDRAGQTHGQALNEFGAKWYVLNSAGAAIVNAPSNAGNSGGGYGY
jgi:hypothetical protein